MSEGTEQISDDEILFRRIPVSQEWYDSSGGSVTPRAFRPRSADKTGLSVSRGKHCSIEESAKGKEGKRYYVAVMRAGDLRRYGLEIASSPENPGHAEITDLIYANRKTDQSVEWQEILAEKLCLRVEGPFPADDNMR